MYVVCNFYDKDMSFTAVTNNTRPPAFNKVGRQSKKAVEIILNSVKIPRQPGKKLRILPVRFTHTHRWFYKYRVQQSKIFHSKILYPLRDALSFR